METDNNSLSFGEITSSEKQGKFAITFVVLVIILAIVFNVYGFIGVVYYINNSGSVDATYHKVYIAGIGLIGPALILMFVCSVITFIMWFWKAYGNLKEMGCWRLSAKGWTIGCWFIPLANIYLPYMFMREMIDETNELLYKKDDLSTARIPPKQVIGWWLVFLSSTVFSQIISKLPLASFQNMVIYGTALFVGALVSIALAYVTVKLIRSYVAAEKILLSNPDGNIEQNL